MALLMAALLMTTLYYDGPAYDGAVLWRRCSIATPLHGGRVLWRRRIWWRCTMAPLLYNGRPCTMMAPYYGCRSLLCLLSMLALPRPKLALFS